MSRMQNLYAVFQADFWYFRRLNKRIVTFQPNKNLTRICFASRTLLHAFVPITIGARVRL
jgi:hypothetical protein